MSNEVAKPQEKKLKYVVAMGHDINSLIASVNQAIDMGYKPMPTSIIMVGMKQSDLSPGGGQVVGMLVREMMLDEEKKQGVIEG
jgi:hypothetical protein